LRGQGAEENTILGIKRDEVTGGWRNLHDVEFHHLTLYQILGYEMKEG
jgi:hypothetical protein